MSLHWLSSESVESRMGAVAWAMRQRSVSHPRSSNRTCAFPASGSPTGFTVKHTQESTDRKRHLRGMPSSFPSIISTCINISDHLLAIVFLIGARCQTEIPLIVS
jgi:hypothetical protein